RAQYNLGLMYHDGDGVAQSDREALYWLTVAQRNADGGDPELAEALERNLVTSPLVTLPPSEHQAVVRSAQSWQPVAFTGFGGTGDSYEDAIDAYDSGDYERAARIWLRLAEDGDAQAQHAIGDLYEYGEGVPVDYAEALRWFQASAKQGFAQGQFRLGVLFDVGIGVAANKPE